MEQDILRKNILNSAGKAAIFLGLASSAYLFLTRYLGQLDIPAFASIAAGIILWAAKFVGCIWLMFFFMKRFVSENPLADNSATFKFGMATALLSAFIFAAASFADVAFISADIYTEQMETIMQNYYKLMDSNTMAMMEKVVEMMPQITFFSNLIYCFLFGTILSAILSRSIPSRDPFSGHQSE